MTLPIVFNGNKTKLCIQNTCMNSNQENLKLTLSENIDNTLNLLNVTIKAKIVWVLIF